MSLYDRAAVIPGRSLTRSKKVFGKWADHADGAMIADCDGKTYIDMLCGLGAISLGYRAVVSCGSMSLPHRVEVEAAEAVHEHVAPWASHVRFLKTGSEATHAAYRIAKRATRHRRVVIGDWAFHGWHEWCDDQSLTTTVRYAHGTELFELTDADDVAAVFVEPHRWEPVSSDWLSDLRLACDRMGALLVFDSMIYGGRMALGGASQYFGVRPDLECFGKAFGNGQSVAFVVGNTALEKHGEIPSGTYSGDGAGLAAVVETLKVYTREPVIETMWERGRQLQRGLDAVIPSSLGVREGQPVHQRIRFHHPDHGEQFAKAMWERGILWHPGCTNIMYAHTPEQIERVIEAAEESVRTL